MFGILAICIGFALTFGLGPRRYDAHNRKQVEKACACECVSIRGERRDVEPSLRHRETVEDTAYFFGAVSTVCFDHAHSMKARQREIQREVDLRWQCRGDPDLAFYKRNPYCDPGVTK